MTNREGFTPSEVKVGFFLAFCLALFLAMLLLYGRFGELWSGRADLRVVFTSVGMLNREAPVYRNGEEVGRVKEMRILRLNDEGLALLPKKLTPSDLPGLPLTPEERATLQAVDAKSFDAECRRLLRDRPMIELTMDVRTDGGRHYYAEDKVRLSVNVLGETAIDVSSGFEGRPWPKDRALVGVAGDFFSNLSKSMGDVRLILQDVTRVVGAEDRLAFKRAMRHKQAVQENLSAVRELFARRAAGTKKNFAAVRKQAAATRDFLGKTGAGLQAEGDRLQEHLNHAQADLGERWSTLKELLAQTREELQTRTEPIMENIAAVEKECGPEIEKTRTATRRTAARFGLLSKRLRGLSENAARLVYQSMPDLAVVRPAFSRSADNLKKMGHWAIRNKDQMASRGYKGEHEYQTALETWAALQRTAADFSTAARAVAALRESLSRWLRHPTDLDQEQAKAVRARLKFLDAEKERLKKNGAAAATDRERTAEALFPPFPRKAGALSPADGE